MATQSNLIAAALHNFTIYKGDTASTQLTFTDSSNNPIDLSGCAIIMQIKAKPGDDTALATFSTANNKLTVTGDDSNVVNIVSWAEVPYSKAPLYYDMQFTFTDGKVVTYLAGKITVSIDVTR